jgi:transposase
MPNAQRKCGRFARNHTRVSALRRVRARTEASPAAAPWQRRLSSGLCCDLLCCDLRPYPLKSQMHDHLDQLLQARKGLSQSLSALQARQRELPRAASALAPAVEALQTQLQEVDRQVALLTRSPEAPELAPVQSLQQVPGIGPVVAATLVSRLSARTFSHSDQFVAYCGLDVRVRQSGKRNGQLGLSKQGEAELRRLLFLAAQASLRAKNSPFKEQYERERAKGLSSTAALCAVARKMARLAWSMVTHGSAYDPERVYQQQQQQQPSPS